MELQPMVLRFATARGLCSRWYSRRGQTVKKKKGVIERDGKETSRRSLLRLYSTCCCEEKMVASQERRITTAG